MKTFFQLREETTGKTLKVSRDIFEAAQQMMSEEDESAIVEAAIHSHADGTTVHHSDEDRGEIYTIKHGGKTHHVNTHAYTVPGETVAGNVKKHIEAQAPGIPSHAKKAIQKHMADM